MSNNVGISSLSLGSVISSTTDIHCFVDSVNFDSIFFGINPWITAKFFVPPGFLKVSSTSFATSAFSCRAKTSRLIFFVNPANSFLMAACLSVNSLIFDSARAYASLGIWGKPSGILKVFELKLLKTFRTFSESSVPEITKIADFSLLSKSYLEIVTPSRERLISS